MTISLALAVSPAAPPAGTVVTAAYTVSGNGSTAGQVVTLSGTAVSGGMSSPFTGSLAIGAGPAAAVTYSVPVCAGLVFARTPDPAVFTATVPASGAVTGRQAVTGSATVGGTAVSAAATVTLPGTVTPPPPPPSGTVPYPAALATGHALLGQYLPADLYAWRFMPGTTTPVTNGSGVGEDPRSPRNVTVTTDGGLPVLKLAVTSTADCGIIQSPGLFPTSSGVIEALVKFSGVTVNGVRAFAGWGSFWLYGPQWPQEGEIDAVESQYGNSYVSYHYGTGSSSQATTDPWSYPAKTVQLSPKNTASAPVVPNILPDAWTYVTLGFGKDASGNCKCDVYYNGTLYCSIAGPYVTGKPMLITAGIGFGGATLGSTQALYDQPGSIEIQYVRVFS